MANLGRQADSARKVTVNGPHLYSQSVLLIDDDPDFLRLVDDELNSISGVHVQTAESSNEALDCLTNESYDLIICDWTLAAHAAPQVFASADPHVFSTTEKTPVIFMS